MADRLFIAVEIDEAVRRGLGALQRALTAPAAHIKWVRPENMHLTLAFLGDTEPDVAAQVKALMDQAAAAMAPLTVEVAGLGFFGSPRAPRVIWAGPILRARASAFRLPS